MHLVCRIVLTKLSIHKLSRTFLSRVCPRFKVVKGAYSSVNVFDNPSEWNKSGIRKKYFTLSDDSDYFDSSGKTDTEWEKTRSNERYSTPSSRRTTQAQSTAQSNRYRLGSMASWDESVAPSTTGPRERFNTAETWEATTIAYVDDIASPPTSQEHSTSNLPPSYSLNSALKKMSRKSSFDAASFPSNNQKAESLVPTLKSRYFGKEAKVKFHDTCNMLFSLPMFSFRCFYYLCTYCRQRYV